MKYHYKNEHSTLERLKEIIPFILLAILWITIVFAGIALAEFLLIQAYEIGLLI